MHDIIDEEKMEGILSYLGNKQYPRIEVKSEKIFIAFNAIDIQAKGMHNDKTAFEGWLFALRDCLKRENTVIVLSLDGEINDKGRYYIGNTYLSRFLYRVLRFKEQYGWLELDEPLKNHVKYFEEYISEGVFTNNIGAGRANESKGNHSENYMEGELAKKGELKKILSHLPDLDIGDNPVNRQLPVGLFSKEVATSNRVFTDGHSAIDLWTWNGDELDVVELKAHNSKTVEIISEIFFYTNYMRDLFLSEGQFTLNEDEEYIKKRLYYDKENDGDQLRGYFFLLKNKENIKRINGIMVADDRDGFNVLVNDRIIEIMNQNNNVGIKYFTMLYDDRRIPRK